MSKGACKDWPTSTFFPEKGDHRTLKLARSICEECPVKTECYDYALEEATIIELLGVWAGTTQKCRTRILKEKGRRASRAKYHDLDLVPT